MSVVFRFTQEINLGIFAPEGWHTASMVVKFGVEESMLTAPRQRHHHQCRGGGSPAGK